MGYIIPTFPKSHLYESKKIAEERIADLSSYFVELLKCNFTQACTPFKDFLFKNENDKNPKGFIRFCRRKDLQQQRARRPRLLRHPRQ